MPFPGVAFLELDARSSTGIARYSVIAARIAALLNLPKQLQDLLATIIPTFFAGSLYTERAGCDRNRYV